MRLYLDSSLRVKLYVPEPDSEALVIGLQEMDAWLVLTRFQFLEMLAAIHRREHAKTLTPDQARAARGALNRDRALGVGFSEVKVDMNEVMGVAIRLSSRLTPLRGARTLDLIHLAIARKLGVKDFATADKKQREAAEAEDFQLYNPRG